MAPITRKGRRAPPASFDAASAVRFSNISRMNMRDSRGAHKLLHGAAGALCENHPWLLWYKDPTTESQFVVYMTQDLNVRLALTSLTAIVIAVFIPLFARVSASIYLYGAQMLVCAAASLVLYHVRWARAPSATSINADSWTTSPFKRALDQPTYSFARQRQLADRVEWTSESMFVSNWLFVVSAVVSKVECRPFETYEERLKACYVSFGWDAVVIIIMLFPVLLTPVRIVASTFCTILTVLVFVLANVVIAPEQLEYKRFWSSLAIVCAQAVVCIGASYVREAQLRKSFEHGLSRQRQTLELEAVRKLALEGAESLVPLQVLTSRIAGRARTATHYVVHFGLAGLAQWALCRGPCDVVWMLEQYNKTLERFMGTLRGGGGVSLESIGDLFVGLVEASTDEVAAPAPTSPLARRKQQPHATVAMVARISPAQEAANLQDAVTVALMQTRRAIRGEHDGSFLMSEDVLEGAGGDVLPAASMDVGLVALHLHSTGRVVADGPVLARGRELLTSACENDLGCTGVCYYGRSGPITDGYVLAMSMDFQRRVAPFTPVTSSSSAATMPSDVAPTESVPRSDPHHIEPAASLTEKPPNCMPPMNGDAEAGASIDEQLRRSSWMGTFMRFDDPRTEERYAAYCRDSGAGDDFLFALASFVVLIAAVCVLICGIYGAWGWSERSPLPYFVAAGAVGVAEMLLAVVEPRAPRHRGVVHAAIEVLYYAFCGCLLFASLVSDMSVAVFGSSMLPMYFVVLTIALVRPLWHSPGVMLLLDVFASVIPFVDVMLPNSRYIGLPVRMNKAIFPCGVLVMLVMRHVMDAAQRDRFVALEGARLAQEKVEKEYALLQVVVEQLAPKRIAALLVDRRRHASRGDGYRGGLHPLVSTAAASSADDLGFAVVRFFVPPSGGFQECCALLLRLVQLLDGPATPETTAVDGSECSTRNRAPLLVSASGDTMVVSSCRAGSAPTAENVTDVMDRVYEMGGIVAQHGGGGSRMSGYVGVCPLMGAMLPGPRVTYQLYGGELTAAMAVVQRAWPLTAGMVVGSARACYYNAEHCRLATDGQRGALQPYCAGPSMRWRLRNVGTLHVHLLRSPTYSCVTPFLQV